MRQNLGEGEGRKAPGPPITKEEAARLLEALERLRAKEAIRRAQAKRRAEAELVAELKAIAAGLEQRMETLFEWADRCYGSLEDGVPFPGNPWRIVRCPRPHFVLVEVLARIDRPPPRCPVCGGLIPTLAFALPLPARNTPKGRRGRR